MNFSMFMFCHFWSDAMRKFFMIPQIFQNYFRFEAMMNIGFSILISCLLYFAHSNKQTIPKVQRFFLDFFFFLDLINDYGHTMAKSQILCGPNSNSNPNHELIFGIWI